MIRVGMLRPGFIGRTQAQAWSKLEKAQGHGGGRGPFRVGGRSGSLGAFLSILEHSVLLFLNFK